MLYIHIHSHKTDTHRWSWISTGVLDKIHVNFMGMGVECLLHPPTRCKWGAYSILIRWECSTTCASTYSSSLIHFYRSVGSDKYSCKANPKVLQTKQKLNKLEAFLDYYLRYCVDLKFTYSNLLIAELVHENWLATKHVMQVITYKQCSKSNCSWLNSVRNYLQLRLD